MATDDLSPDGAATNHNGDPNETPVNGALEDISIEPIKAPPADTDKVLVTDASSDSASNTTSKALANGDDTDGGKVPTNSVAANASTSSANGAAVTDNGSGTIGVTSDPNNSPNSVPLEEEVKEEPIQMLIDELKSITNFWSNLAKWCVRLHWAVGVIGIIAATLASNNRFRSDVAAGFATTAALCLAITGFVNPQKRAARFLSGYRLLDPAIRAYKYKVLSKRKLLETHMRAEAIIQNGEFDSK